MTEQILIELSRLEYEKDITILYAVESGSRAWGFASTDSDWDVRFIYIHKPDWYLSIDEKKDNIEQILPNDIDLGGWELRKALRLFRKSNPPLLEWLRSPIIYLEKYDTASRLRAFMEEYFNPKSCMHHYLHMADGNYRTYLEKTLVKSKKYFYVLRPVLACQWIEKYSTMPPIEFSKLLSLLPEGELKGEISQLLNRKIAGEELKEEPRVAVIADYLGVQIDYYRTWIESFKLTLKPDTERLNNLFRDTLEGVSLPKQ